MTHYTVSYEALEGNAKRAKALEDIVEYMGWAKFTDLCIAAHADFPEAPPTLESWKRMLSFAGVQGYPAKAWYEVVFGELSE